MYRISHLAVVLLIASPFAVRPLAADLHFGNPVNLGPAINTMGHENTAELSPNGLELIYTSTRPGGLGESDFWVAGRQSIHDDWQPASHLGATVNSSALELSPELSADGLTLYFDSGRPGSQGQDLWSSSRDDLESPWQRPVNLGSGVNKPLVDIVPSVTADHRSLIFTDGDPFFFQIPPARQGLGGVDLWISTRTSETDKWGEAVNFGHPVNSQYDEGAADISQDGLMLVFTSDRPGGQGGPDLWMSTRETTDVPWGEPFNLGPNVNYEGIDWVPRFSPDGQSIFFGSYRAGGHGGEDIWRIDVLGSTLLDCSNDGQVSLLDLDCASSATIGQTLSTLGLLAGDLDVDGKVAFADFVVLSSNFNQRVDTYAAGDIDRNGMVEFDDFLAMSENFGKVSDQRTWTVAVPEPRCMGLLLVGLTAAGLVRRRRRASRPGISTPPSLLIVSPLLLERRPP